MSLKRCWSWAMGGNDPPMDDSMTKTFWGFHRAVGHHHEDSQSSAHILQTRSFQSFSSSKPLVVVLVFFQKLRLVLFRNWDWQALVVSVFPVPAGPAGLSWWIVDCFFHMPVFAPHLHIKWLDTELEVWSHQPHQSQPCHELPDAPPKNIPRAWDLDGVFGWFFDVFWWNWWNCDILSRRLGEIAPICQSCDDQPKIAALTLPFHLVLLRTS